MQRILHYIIPILCMIINQLTFGHNMQDDKLYVPVVVHVVYGDEDQNISNAQIISQIEAINHDFARTNDDAINTLEAFQSVAANTNVSFYLAQIDPTGNTTEGITRTFTTHGVFANDDIHFSELGGKDAWTPSEYLNVWVCDLPPLVYGLSSTPDKSSQPVDGVVIDHQSFGTIGTAISPTELGRTMTHEVGHYLGLEHPWGLIGGCDNDDGIDDTPVQNEPNTDCNLSSNSCGTLDMTQNFMNIADDSCLNLFTIGQKNSMRNVLTTIREGLVNNDKGRNEAVTAIHNVYGERGAIYPNPSFSGEFILEDFELTTTMNLFDLSGKSIPFQVRKIKEQMIITIQETGHFILQWNRGKQVITTKLINH